LRGFHLGEDEVAGVEDFLAVGEGALNLFFELILAEDTLLRRLVFEVPVEGEDLLFTEADEGIAGFDGVGEEGEGLVFGEGGQPEGELGEIGGHRVAVDAVEATLGDEAAGVEGLVLAKKLRLSTMGGPRSDEFLAELAAGFDEEGTGADSGVADFEVEDLFGKRLLTEVGEDRFESLANDGLGKLSRGIVGARLATGFGGLEEECAFRDDLGGGVASDEGGTGGGALEDSENLLVRRGGLQLLELACGELAVGLLLDPRGYLGGLDGEEFVEFEERRRALHLSGLDRYGRASGDLELEPHHGLVNGADLLDVECPIGKALALQDEEFL